MRTLTGAEFQLTVYTETTAGDPADADLAVGYTVRDGAGDTLDSGTATRIDLGVYTLDVAALDAPDTLSVVVEYEVNAAPRREVYAVEVAGSRAVPRWLLRETIDEDREEQGFLPVDDEQLDRILVEVEDTFASALGFPPFVRPLRATVDSKGGLRLRVPGAAYPIDVHGAWFGDDEPIDGALAKRFHLVREGGAHWPRGLIDLHLSHGLEAVPGDLQRAAYIYGRELARKNTHPARATEIATEGAVFSLATPGSATPTGVPEVDGVLIRHRLRV